MLCLVIGNGESRKNINLNNFQSDITIGCNALHRDMILDHLVCCDRRMAEEAITGNNTTDTKIYVRDMWHRYFRKIKKDKRIHQLPQVPDETEFKKDQAEHWGSGPYAVLLAADLEQVSEIHLVGFDLYSKNELVNNIYKGTQNYSSSKSKPIDYSYWVHQIGKVFKTFPNKKFVIHNIESWEFPKQWKYPNVSYKVLVTKNLTFA